MRRRVARWLASPRKGQRAAIVISILISLPALGVGFIHDDFLHRLPLEGAVPGYAPQAHELYDFTRDDPPRTQWFIEEGFFPWLTHPELVIRFFRPIAGALLGLDAALFGRNALFAHVHSLLWLIVCLVATASIHRRALRPSTASVATLVFGIAGAHAVTTAWLAARHTLVAAAFGAIAIAAHLAWRDRHSQRGAVIAPLFVALALATSEAGLGAVAFIVLYEVIVPGGAIGRRVFAASPAIVLALAHLAFYTLEGYGTHHSAAYVSPFDDPAAFASAIVTRTPILAGDLYGGVPCDLGMMAELATPLAIFGIVTTLGCALLAARAQLPSPSRRRLLWLGASSILCLLPMVGGVIGGRLLPIALIGSSAIVATAILEAWRTAGRGARGFGLRAAVVAVGLLHFGLSPLVRISEPSFMGGIAEAEERYARQADLRACEDRELAYMLTGSDPVNSMYGAPLLRFYTPEAVEHLERSRVLSMAPHALTLRVLSPDRFELEVRDGPRRVNLFEQVYRDAPIEPGLRVRARELTVTVLDAENGLPTRTSFVVEGGLDRVCFAEWRGGRMRTFRPPRVGEERILVHELGPMGL